MPATSPYAALALDLLDSLRELHHRAPSLEPRDLALALEPLLIFGHKHKLLPPKPSSTKPTKATADAAGKVLQSAIQDALSAASTAAASTAAASTAAGAPTPLPGSDRKPGKLRYQHAMIHVAPDWAYYSFAAPYVRTYNKRTSVGVGLTSIDSSGKHYPTAEIDRHLRKRVAEIERAAARCAPHLLTDPPDLLLDPLDHQPAIQRLRDDFPAGLPFRHPLHERRLRMWCLMSYLYPLVDSTPFLRVRVPDIRSARSVQHLLESCCWNALGVSRSGMKAAIRRHRTILAGTTIFSPELRTGRLPAAALDLLEDPPISGQFEPPVAYIEVWDDTAQPYVPEEWIIDVELGGQVAPQPLPWDHRYLGCAVALADSGALLAKAPVHEGAAGLARWLQVLLYGDLLSDKQLAGAAVAAEQAERFAISDSELAGFAEEVWSGCLAESQDDQGATKGAKRCTQQLRCNPTCLRQRMIEKVPRSRALLDAEGWKHFFSRKLLEQGVVTYTVKNLYGCLSPVKSAEWKTRKVRGVVVPKRRLPAGAPL